MMLFKRKIYSQLLSWKNQSNGKTALLIEGARRVGKSTIVEEFAKAEYKNYILINFTDASTKIKNLFRNHLDDLDVFFQLLQIETGVRLEARKSLVIFDEVQRFPIAREAVKTLVADGRYDYIETGSLISINENVEGILIPSEEKSICMYPMDFDEFLEANGETPLSEYIHDCFDKKEALDDDSHKKAMLLIKQYMIVGGMPQSVAAYLENSKDFLASDTAKRAILELYRKDISKAEKKYRSKVLALYTQLPGFLSKHEKKIVLNDVDKNGRYVGYSDAFFWLGDSMITNLCTACTDPNVGLALNEDSTQIKCYMGDTGLLLSHTFTPEEIENGELYKEILHDRLSINEGMFFENLVAQSFRSKNHELYFYTHYNLEAHRNDIEIDFLLSNGSKTNFKIEPVEVKSSKNYTTTSFTEFKKRFGKRISNAYVIHPKAFKIEDGVTYLPIYMAGCL